MKAAATALTLHLSIDDLVEIAKERCDRIDRPRGGQAAARPSREPSSDVVNFSIDN
jgi:hypothetical protein